MSATPRVGFGYDLHRLAAGRSLWLGGVCIEYDRGLVGHSDADVLVHAAADAILGAASLGDIGMHFPDSEGRWKDMKGAALMARVVDMAREGGYRVMNVDCVLHAERPKLSAYRARIRESLASMIGIALEDVNIKFKTNEGLDAVGRAEAIAASAVALVAKDV